MGCLKILAFIQLILPAIVGIVSGAYFSTLTVLKNFGFCYILVTSTACAFCFKKFLEHHRHCKHVSGNQVVKQMLHLNNSENISTFVNFPEELSDFREKFHRRRLSYPLQPSEKINYTVLKLVETFDKKCLVHKDNARRDDEFKDEENQNMNKSDEMRLNLRKCISNIEDSIEKLSLITKKNISDLEGQSKSNVERLRRTKYSKKKDKDMQSLNQNVVSTSIVNNLGNFSDISTEAKQEMSLPLRQFERPVMKPVETDNPVSLNNPEAFTTMHSKNLDGASFKEKSENPVERNRQKTKMEDSFVIDQNISQLQVARLVNPAARQHVISKRALQNKQLKNFQRDLKKNKELQQNSKIGRSPNSKYKNADSSMDGTTLDPSGLEEKLGQRSITDSQKANVSVQQIYEDTTSGTTSEQSKLEQILEQPEIRELYISPNNKGAACSESGGLFRNSSDSTTFENYLKDFTSNEDIKKKLESTHMSFSSDNLKLMDRGGYFHPSNVEEAFSFIWDTDLPLSRYSSENTDLNSKAFQNCFKTMSSGIISDFSNFEECVQHSNRDSTSSVDSKNAWSSSESIFVTEPSDFILYPLPLEKEQVGSSAVECTTSQTANEASSAIEYTTIQAASEVSSSSGSSATPTEYTKQAANEVSSSSSQAYSDSIVQSASQLNESEKQPSNTDSKNPEIQTGNKHKKKSVGSILFKIRKSFKFGNNRKLHTKDKEPKP